MAVAQRPRCHVQRFFEELGFNLKQAHGAERPSSQRAQGLRRFVVAAPGCVDGLPRNNRAGTALRGLSTRLDDGGSGSLRPGPSPPDAKGPAWRRSTSSTSSTRTEMTSGSQRVSVDTACIHLKKRLVVLTTAAAGSGRRVGGGGEALVGHEPIAE